MINKLVKRAHKLAKAKGWWDCPRSGLEIAALIHTEVSEFVEEIRNNQGEPELHYASDGKPLGELVELADVVIRIADYCGYKNWDLAKAIKEKMKYNATRPYRHGKKC